MTNEKIVFVHIVDIFADIDIADIDFEICWVTVQDLYQNSKKWLLSVKIFTEKITLRSF